MLVAGADGVVLISLAAGAVAEFVYELEREPARELQKGGLALPDTRRIASALGIEVDDVATVHWLAERSGLVSCDGVVWLSTDDAEAWAALSTAARWAKLAAWPGDTPPGTSTRRHRVAER